MSLLSYYRLYLCLLFFSSSLHLAKAQEKDLRQAPEANVKTVTEWITLLDHKEEVKSTHKRMTYNYHENGSLDSLIGSDFKPHFSHCQYFSNGKLSKVYSSSEHDSIFVRYTYHNDREIQDFHLLGKNQVSRKVSYFNAKNQLKEVKEFEKGGSIGNEFRLIYRSLYNYNEEDSLFAEMHYHYMLYSSKTPSSQSKVVHQYDADKKYRTQTLMYNKNGELTEEINFKYNDQNQLTNKIWTYPGKEFKKEKTLQYKDGKLWQDSFFDGYHKTVKVYKDGRYIRKKQFSPDGKLSSYVDFQYGFYE